MDQLVGFLLHPQLSKIDKKIGQMLKYTPTFKVLSAPLHIMLRSYLPTSHISRFSSPLIPYAGLGINSTISPYATGALIFVQQNIGIGSFLSRNVFYEIYLIKHLSFNSDFVFCFIGVLQIPKKNFLDDLR